MVSGEFVSMTALHDTIPEVTPAPIAWGTYASNSNVQFFLCHFIDVIDEVPDIETFTPIIADLHARSVSPTASTDFQRQHTWAKWLSTLPGQILGKISLQTRWNVG